MKDKIDHKLVLIETHCAEFYEKLIVLLNEYDNKDTLCMDYALLKALEVWEGGS